MSDDYPWYALVNVEGLQQGDIVRNYPVFLQEPFATAESGEESEAPQLEGNIINIDAVVVSQSCDLVNRKIDSVILCPVHNVANIEESFGDSEKSRNKRKEEIRQGKEPGFHMICADSNIGIDLSIVEFKRIYTTPKSTLVEFVKNAGDRVRILPPYREHLSQAFARYFMRVGLPEDIPKFG